MTDDLSTRLESCIGDARRGVFDEAAWRRLFADARTLDRPRRQHLLYIQAATTHVGSPALGMSLVDDGDGQLPADPRQWPYQNVLGALADGWRIIAFPSAGQVGDPARLHGLGCEFILEQWR